MGFSVVIVMVQLIISSAVPAPTAAACSIRTGPRVVRVRFYNQSRLDERRAATIVQIANRIWAQNGIVIRPADDAAAIDVVLVDAPSSGDSKSLPMIIGTTTFANGHATPHIRLSLRAAEQLAETGDTEGPSPGIRPVATVDEISTHVLGVALAHELAHYLLDTAEHSSEGLLRVGFSVREMEKAEPARFSLTCAQRQTLMTAR